jgi:hypothetical protein
MANHQAVIPGLLAQGPLKGSLQVTPYENLKSKKHSHLTKRIGPPKDFSRRSSKQTVIATMSDDEDIAALVIDNGSGMCKGKP